MFNPEKTTYTFIPGKNWKLSLAELLALSKARNYQFRVTGLSKSFFTIATDRTLDPTIIDDLGGTIKIGRVISSIPLETAKDAFLHKSRSAQTAFRANLSECVPNQTSATPLKECVFGVSLYIEDYDLFRFSGRIQRCIGSYFKEKLASSGTRARFMGFPRNRQLPQLTHVEVLKKELISKSFEILFCLGRDQGIVATTLAVHNPFEFQKRDMERPIQRKIFSIPPRLAKIMVNLSSCSPGKVFLDPFCGTGTILQEALLARARVRGMDINPWCIKASCTNLEWVKKEYRLQDADYTILLGDARHLAARIEKETIDCIATEPDLGPALRHLPTEEGAKKIQRKLRPLYHDFLKEAHIILRDGRNMVLTTPHIRTRNGSFVSSSMKEDAATRGFKPVFPFNKEFFASTTSLIEDLTKSSSLIEIGQRHKIGREIHVLQK